MASLTSDVTCLLTPVEMLSSEIGAAQVFTNPGPDTMHDGVWLKMKFFS